MNWLQQIAEWLSRFKCWYIVRPWEQGIRVRCGKWVAPLSPGLLFRIPLLDEVFVQNTRQRVLNLPTQTVTTKTGITVTLSGVVSWRVSDVRTLYDKLHTPDDWIYNTVLSALAQAVSEFDGTITPKEAAEQALERLKQPTCVGIEISGVSITDFAIVRTYRLISGEGNSGWTWNRVGALDNGVH